jgi:hypothetical protein
MEYADSLNRARHVVSFSEGLTCIRDLAAAEGAVIGMSVIPSWGIWYLTLRRERHHPLHGAGCRCAADMYGVLVKGQGEAPARIAPGGRLGFVAACGGERVVGDARSG